MQPLHYYPWSRMICRTWHICLLNMQRSSGRTFGHRTQNWFEAARLHHIHHRAPLQYSGTGDHETLSEILQISQRIFEICEQTPDTCIDSTHNRAGPTFAQEVGVTRTSLSKRLQPVLLKFKLKHGMYYQQSSSDTSSPLPLG